MKLIDKDALVTEIKKRIKVSQDYAKCNLTEKTRIGNYAQQLELKGILDFLDILEVKDIDLEKEVELWYGEYAGNRRFDWNGFAKHFFELGLKAQKGE